MEELSYSISPDWDNVEIYSEKAGDIFKEKSINLAHAVLMVSSELLENAIKYGEYPSDKDVIKYELNGNDKSISIAVTNKVKSEDDVKKVEKFVADICDCDDKFDLYTERMMDLKKNRKDGESMLGFYRIAYEGKFDIDCKHEKGIMTIIAKRNLKEGK